MVEVIKTVLRLATSNMYELLLPTFIAGIELISERNERRVERQLEMV